MTIALLDSGPLSLVTHPRANPENTRCKTWLSAFLAAGNSVLVPEITFYEVRRELRRSELKNGVLSRGLANLDRNRINETPGSSHRCLIDPKKPLLLEAGAAS